MRKDDFGLQIIVGGQPLKEFESADKTYVVAPAVGDFALRLMVPYGSRTLAVGSVDGIDIGTGKNSGVCSCGYFLAPPSHFGNRDISGYRLDLDQVAKFCFGKRNDGQSALLDEPSNVGVIEVVFYAGEESPAQGVSPRHDGDRFDRVIALDMGLFGTSAGHPVSTINFDRGAVIERLVIQYASEAALRQAGVIS